MWTKSHNLVGKRIELHPATDDWMRGDRYGEVVSVEIKHDPCAHDRIVGARVRLDKSHRVKSFHGDNVRLVG